MAEETASPKKPAELEKAEENDLPDFMALEDFIEEPTHAPETKSKSEKKKASAADSWHWKDSFRLTFNLTTEHWMNAKFMPMLFLMKNASLFQL